MSEEPVARVVDGWRHIRQPGEGECPDGCWGCAAEQCGVEDFVGPTVTVEAAGR